jgi:hypothetical protein
MVAGELASDCEAHSPPNRRTQTRMSGGEAGEAGQPVPLCRSRS